MSVNSGEMKISRLPRANGTYALIVRMKPAPIDVDSADTSMKCDIRLPVPKEHTGISPPTKQEQQDAEMCSTVPSELFCFAAPARTLPPLPQDPGRLQVEDFGIFVSVPDAERFKLATGDKVPHTSPPMRFYYLLQCDGGKVPIKANMIVPAGLRTKLEINDRLLVDSYASRFHHVMSSTSDSVELNQLIGLLTWDMTAHASPLDKRKFNLSRPSPPYMPSDVMKDILQEVCKRQRLGSPKELTECISLLSKRHDQVLTEKFTSSGGLMTRPGGTIPPFFEA